MARRTGPLSAVEQFERDRQVGDRVIRRRNLRWSLPLMLATPIVVFALCEITGAVVNHLWRTTTLNPAHRTNPIGAAHMTMLSGSEITLLGIVFAMTAALAMGRIVWGGSESRVERHQAARIGRQARREVK